MSSLVAILSLLLSTLPCVLSAPIEAASAVPTTATPTWTPCAPPPCRTPPPVNCPKPPSCDPWYQCPPQDWASRRPGDVLALREAPGNAIDMITPALTSKIYNVLFRTNDSLGNPTWAVTTIFKPSKMSGTAPNYKLMSYQHFYDSADVDRSPSCLLYDKNDAYLKMFINRYLDLGWYVNVPDYEGRIAAFGAGRLSGQATLDSIRAVLSMGGLVGLNASPDIAMYGYSGGSIATGWAAELVRAYAPQLKVKVAGIGGAIPDFEHSLHRILDKNITDWGNQTKEVLIGLGNQWPEVQNLTMKVFGVQTWENVRNKLHGISFADLRSTYFACMANSTALSTILATDGSLGHAIPNMPLFIHRARDDNLATTEDTDALFKYYTDSNANVYYHITPPSQISNTNAHEKEGLLGALMAAPYYLQDAVNGNFPKGPPPYTRLEKEWGGGDFTGAPAW